MLNMYGYYLAIQELIILLSAAEAQLHKILAIVAPRYDFGVESSKQARKVSIYENWRHVAIGFKLVVLPKLSHTSSFTVLELYFNFYGTVLDYCTCPLMS